MNKSFSLKSILIYFLTLVVALSIILIGTISYTIFSTTITEQIATSRIDVLSQISERITALNEKIEVVSNFYHYNNIILDQYDDNTFDEKEETLIIDKFHQIDRLSHETIKALGMEFNYKFVVDNEFSYDSEEGKTNLSIKDYEKELWYSRITDAEGQTVWVSTHMDESKDEYVFSLARSIINPENRENIGLFLFDVSEKNISDTYENLINNNEIYVVDSEGNIISHSNKEMLGINFYEMDTLDRIFEGDDYKIIEKNDREYLFSKYINQEYNWLLVEEIPLVNVLAPLKKIRNYIILCGLLVFAVCIGIIIILSTKTTAPLMRLCKQLESVGNQNRATTVFDIKGWQEIDKICDECNHMNDRILSLVKDIKREESDKRKAEMGFLQSQINPHFLYNTLFSIKCMVDMGDKEKAIGIIDAFTAIMKYILSYSEPDIFIFEELKFIDDYMSLQRYRYGDRFNFEMTCDDSILNHKILRMIIQPLIENAILHGTKDEKKVINIALSITDFEDKIKIVVSDDGAGMSNEIKNTLWKSKSEDSQSNMIGMKNITDRIKMNYGSEYDLNIISELGKGVKAIVIIPKNL